MRDTTAEEGRQPRRLTHAELLIALALAEGPAHGYRLMQRAGQIEQDATALGAATLYRTLRRMLDDGLVAHADTTETTVDERRRPYRLTDDGLHAVAAEGRRMAALVGEAVARGIPERFHSLTVQLTVRDTDAAISFYTNAFAARELSRHHHSDGRISHAELNIGDSILLVHDDFSDLDGPAAPTCDTGVTIHLYVPDADTTFERALAAGATVVSPMADRFWGDRYGILVDPYAHRWSIGTGNH
ncbi:helix-turn-helix transcriptional regulator [Nocardia sp. N2S4-5]|uniref:helix-turn-helix transcriptional regulator n=1 Tax=Nocardia sp. N2S4-5 TaxID=3351565 RepID=UPI0037D05B97